MNNQTDKIPKMFLCPITGEIISDPWVVVTENGGTCHSYEKEAIETWMKNHDTDPLTRHKRKSVGCNISLKHAIELYLNQLKVEELRNDPGLLSEVENWIRRRGGIEKLREDSNMHNLVRNVEQVKESKSADSSVELKHDE
jgi:Cft2 family RNA processing exonuclease